MKKRSKASQLPDANGLSYIFLNEAKRDVPKSNINKHFVSLEPLNILRDYGVDLRFIKADGFDDIIGLGNQFIDSFIQKLKDGIIPAQACDALFQYLAEVDEPSRADGIFVFGRDDDIYRVIKGVELYQQGLASTLILSGGHPAYKSVEGSEAEIMRDYAVSHGVPQSDIIIEPNSMTISDNIKSSLNLFDKVNYQWDSLIIVISPFAMRRAFGFFQKYTTNKKFIRIGASYPNNNTSKEEWLQQEESIRLVMNEYVKHRVALFTNTC